jgi:carbon monoxide dehydrogenase subunit G
MIISNERKIAQNPDLLYASLIDLDAVAPCIPGATLGVLRPDGSREATIEVAFGPMRFGYDGTVRIVEEHPTERSAVLKAVARETSGEGNATATIEMTITTDGADSMLHIDTDLRVSGGIAQIGAGMIEEVGEELLDEFGTALAARDLSVPVAAPPAGAAPAPAAPLRGHRLVLRALRRRLRRLFRRRTADRGPDDRNRGEDRDA